MKVLIVDDDPGLCDLVSFTLAREGFAVLQAHDPQAAIHLWRREQPDLILLDIYLSTAHGFSVLREVRANGERTPVLMLSASQREDDLVEALALGADEYIHKPFQYRVFVARVKALLRRAGNANNSEVKAFELPSLTYNGERREVRLANGQRAILTVLEARLLTYLFANYPRIVPSEVIIGHVWGPEGADHDMVRQLIKRLRGKIDTPGTPASLITTLAGYGYGLANQE